MEIFNNLINGDLTQCYSDQVKKPLLRKLYPKAPLSLASLEKPARKPPRNQAKTLFLVT